MWGVVGRLFLGHWQKLIVAAVVIGCGWYIYHTYNKVKLLQSENATLSNSLADSNHSIKVLKSEIKTREKLNRKLKQRNQTINDKYKTAKETVNEQVQQNQKYSDLYNVTAPSSLLKLLRDHPTRDKDDKD